MKSAAFICLLLIATVSASPSSEVAETRKLGDGLGHFIFGILIGFEANASEDSMCVIELEQVIIKFDLLVEDLSQIFSNYVYLFVAMNGFADFMDDFDQAVKSCEFSRLAEQIQAFMSTAGKAAVLARLAIKSEVIIAAWKAFYYGVVSGQYQAAGTALGNILSMILNFNV